MQDLVILVADKSMEQMIRHGLSRHVNLGIRPIAIRDKDIIVHPNRDPGVRTTGVDVLRLYARTHEHALMVMDYEGCGEETRDAKSIEQDLDQALAVKWGDRAKAVVIVPELDVWAWGGDSVIESLVDWRQPLHVRDWLVQQGYSFDSQGKPQLPKEALQAVMRKCRRPRSSDLYGKIARTIGLGRCSDQSFIELRDALRSWFPAVYRVQS